MAEDTSLSHDDNEPGARSPSISISVGDRVRVHQQIPQRNDAWVTKLEGTVVSYRQTKTGSWFAHSKDDRLWLDRLEIRKDDGEVTICNLDQFSRVEIVNSDTPA